jgi:hypothetical protein
MFFFKIVNVIPEKLGNFIVKYLSLLSSWETSLYCIYVVILNLFQDHKNSFPYFFTLTQTIQLLLTFYTKSKQKCLRRQIFAVILVCFVCRFMAKLPLKNPGLIHIVKCKNKINNNYYYLFSINYLFNSFFK